MIELELTESVEVSHTSVIRASLRAHAASTGLAELPVELVRFHVLILCTAGRGQHMVDFVAHEVSAGTAIWVRPGQVQQWDEVHSGFEADVVVFASASVPELPLFEWFLGATPVTRLGPDAARAHQLMAWMVEDLSATGDQLIAASVVRVLLRLFARRAEVGFAGAERGGRGANASGEWAPTPARRLVTAFMESVERNIDRRSVAWHANQIGASTRTVARATAEVLDRTPKHVIDARVVLEAQRRLAWSDHSVDVIARALGFSEASNFTKFFRARTGQPPSAFRARRPAGRPARPPSAAAARATSRRAPR